MTKSNVAEIVSRLTGMHVWFPILLLLCLFKTGLTPKQIAILFPSLFFLSIVIPVVYIAIGLKINKLSGWDLPKRNERYMFFITALISSTVSVGLIYIFGTKLFFSLSLVLLLQMILMGIITRFWKISLHTSLTTSSILTINFFFHWQLPILYFIIPLVAWSRYVLKRHTISQIIAGILVSGVFTVLAFAYLGYL